MNDYNSEKTVRNKITIISFVCSLFVIWIHTYNVEYYGINANSTGFSGLVWKMEIFWAEVIRIAVPTFFFLSGFLFFRTFSMDKLLEKYKSRAKSIVLPYIVWCTIYYFYFVFLTNAPIIKNYMNAERYEPSFANWLKALWPEEYYTFWFLKNLICFIVATPVIYVMLKNYFNIPTGGVIVLLLMLNSIFGLVETPSGIEMYAAGSYIAINHKGIEHYKNRNLSCASIVVILLLFVTKLMVLNVPLMVLFVLSLWFSLDLINLECEMPWWLSITFFTYAFHDMVLEMLEKLWLVLAGSNPLFALLDYLFMPIIAFVVIAIVASFLRRIRPVWGLLCGYR